MTQKRIGLLLVAIGVIVLVSSWDDVSQWIEASLKGEAEVRPMKVVIWTSSGSPERELKKAHDFERDYPRIDVETNFRETGGLQDIFFMSFLSGNPPDVIDVPENELRKFVRIGGIMPLSPYIELDNALLRNQYLRRELREYREEVEPLDLAALPSKEELERGNKKLIDELVKYRIEAWRETFRQTEGRAPGAEAIETRRRETRADILAASRDLYYEQDLLGKARIKRFWINPDDRMLRPEQIEEHPQEAARLLEMHGKIVGFRGIGMPTTLTYNKRLFREAAKMFPDAGLVDDEGRAVPPKTWIEYYKVARVLTEYGRREAERQGLSEPVCYGAVVQGQRPHDIMRGIRPLANRAGTTGFNFRGDKDLVLEKALARLEDPEKREELREAYAGRNIGYFEYDNDAFVAAFALFKKLKEDGLILPGTASRHYEDSRTALASGKAGLLLDGWHAALIGVERVPWASDQLGSAPVPIPYHDVNPDAGWTEDRVREEREALSKLLALEEAGIELPPGNKLPRAVHGAAKVRFFTSLCRDPRAAWEWENYTNRAEEILKTETRRGSVTELRAGFKHRGDPEWFPYPYQDQVYDILLNHCEFWPQAPLHGSVQPDNQSSVIYKYFYERDIDDMATVLEKTRQELAEYNEAVNRNLAQRIVDGIANPRNWTFPDFTPRRASAYFEQQQAPPITPEMQRKLDEARKLVIETATKTGRDEIVTATPAGMTIRDDVWKWQRARDAYLLWFIPGLLVGLIVIWLVYKHVEMRDRGGLPKLIAEARHRWHGYLFVLPGVLLIFAFAIWPSVYQFYLSLQSGDGLGAMQWVGLKNYQQILNPWHPNFDKVFWHQAVPHTLMYMILVVTGQITIGLLMASFLNLPLKANRFYRVLFFIPLATSLAVVSVILIGFFKGDDSGVNELLVWISDATGWEGIKNVYYYLGAAEEPGQLGNLLGSELGIYTIVLVGIWHGLAFRIILLLAGLQSIDPQLYDAADVDGAGPWRRFWHITVPEMLPILGVIAFMALVGAARVFSPVFILTEGGADHSSEVVGTHIFKKGFMKPEGQEADLGYAAALGIVYSVMLASLTLANVIIVARRWKSRLRAERQAGAPAPTQEVPGEGPAAFGAEGRPA